MKCDETLGLELPRKFSGCANFEEDTSDDLPSVHRRRRVRDLGTLLHHVDLAHRVRDDADANVRQFPSWVGPASRTIRTPACRTAPRRQSRLRQCILPTKSTASGSRSCGSCRLWGVVRLGTMKVQIGSEQLGASHQLPFRATRLPPGSKALTSGAMSRFASGPLHTSLRTFDVRPGVL